MKIWGKKNNGKVQISIKFLKKLFFDHHFQGNSFTQSAKKNQSKLEVGKLTSKAQN